jgi:chemotaxis protein CheZ
MSAMIESSHQRKFTAELRRASLAAPREEEGPFSLNDDSAEERHREVLDALAEIRRLLGAGSGAPQETAGGGGGPVLTPAAPCPAEASRNTDDEMRGELQALHSAITQTKREIAALREMGKPPSHLATATDELDAVVTATETATECILAASERIDELLTGLRNQSASVEETAGIDEVGEQVTRIFEACNFQDITGQRITRVMTLLRDVDERLLAIIEHVGQDRFGAEPPPLRPRGADEALLNGPATAGSGLRQASIDSLFAR